MKKEDLQTHINNMENHIYYLERVLMYDMSITDKRVNEIRLSIMQLAYKIANRKEELKMLQTDNRLVN